MKNIHGGPAVNPCTQGPEFGVTPLAMISAQQVYGAVLFARGGCLQVNNMFGQVKFATRFSDWVNAHFD